MRRSARFYGLLSVLISWGLFLFLLARVWPYQGVLTGEAQGGAAAYAWIHQIPGMFLRPTVSLFGWKIPLMYNYFHGPWGIYLLAPFVALGGCTLATLRIYSAFMFLLAIWGTWRITFLVTKDEIAAFMAATLLAVCPAMIMTRSESLSAPDVAASVWTLVFALSYVRTRKTTHAWAACAAFFLGLCTRTWVAGLGVGLLLYAALTWKHVLNLLPPSSQARERLICGGAIVAGIFVFPILAYNATHGWVSVLFYANDTVQRHGLRCGLPGYAACSNLAYWTNLKFNVHQLKIMCDGTRLVIFREPWHWLYVGLLLISFVFTLRNSWRRRTLWNSSAALWIVALGYFLVAAITPTTQTISHLTCLIPILAVLSVLWIAAVPIKRRRIAIIVMAVACVVQFSGDVWLFRKWNVDVAAHHWYEMSPLVIDVCHWAGKEARTPVVSLSQPFTEAAPYFSQGRAILLPWPYWEPHYRMPWKQWLLRKDKPYFLTEDSLETAKVAELKAEAKKLGVALVRVKVFPDPLGHPAFEVYRVR